MKAHEKAFLGLAGGGDESEVLIIWLVLAVIGDIVEVVRDHKGREPRKVLKRVIETIPLVVHECIQIVCNLHIILV